MVTHNDNLKQKVDEVKATIRFQMKKVGVVVWDIVDLHNYTLIV